MESLCSVASISVIERGGVASPGQTVVKHLVFPNQFIKLVCAVNTNFDFGEWKSRKVFGLGLVIYCLFGL